jgi:hypothetical protein
MTVDPLLMPAALLVTITGMILLVSRDWRASISLLSIQYIGVFLLILRSWPLAMAVTQLVAGWMAGAILGIAVVSLTAGQTSIQEDLQLEGQDLGREPPAHLRGLSMTQATMAFKPSLGRAFYVISGLLILLAVYSNAPLLSRWVPNIQIEQSWGGLILIGIGLLKLSIDEHPFHSILGLLTVLAGFGIIYAVVQSAPLIAGLLAALSLGNALGGAYLLISPYSEETD